MEIKRITYAILIVWFTGNLGCIFFEKNLWPSSAFDMFTRFRQKSDVYVIQTEILNSEGACLYCVKEDNLPVIRFWENNQKMPLSIQKQANYVESYILFHPHLKALTAEKSRHFRVSKVFSDPSEGNSLTLLDVNLSEIFK